MGSIIKRGKNTWLLKYDLPRHPDGRRNQKYETVHGNLTEAKQRLAERLTELRQGTYVAPKNTRLASWLEKWLSTHAEPNVTPKTYERYAQLSRVHIIPALGGIPLQRLSIPDIQAFYTALHKDGLSKPKKDAMKARGASIEKVEAIPTQGLSPRTIRHVHRVLSMALSEAVRSNEIYKNPAKDMKLPRFASKESAASGTDQVKALTKAQLTELLEHFKGKPLHTLISFAAGTGMRQGEILALRWSDVDFDKAQVTVRHSVEDSKLGLRIKQPKSRKIRYVPLAPELVAALHKHRKNQLETGMMLGTRLPGDALVFQRSPLEQSAPMRRHGLSRAVSDVCAALGFPGHSFHSLRHTFASLCLTAENPVPLNIVSKCLGHANPGITASIYSHFIGDEYGRTTAAVGGFLGAALSE